MSLVTNRLLLNTPFHPMPYVAIAAGGYHALAIAYDGKVYAWGDNSRGQTTVPAAAMSGVIAIAAGEYHSVALKSDGTVVLWGDDRYNLENIDPAANNGFIAIACGPYHTVGLKSNGTVAIWGEDSYKQVSGGSVSTQGITLKTIAAGTYHTASITSNGTIISWGDNTYGQLNAISTTGTAKFISCGYSYTLGLLQDGTVVQCGKANPYSIFDPRYFGHNMGSGFVISTGLLPIENNNRIKAISSKQLHNLALRDDGKVIGWGYNDKGQLDIPSNLENVVAIATGNNFSLALRSDGYIIAWGQSTLGETIIPNTSSTATSFPKVRIFSPGYSNGFYQNLALGYDHCIALKGNGKIVEWGTGSSAVPIPKDIDNVISVTAGYFKSNWVLKANGTVRSWGRSYSTVPANIEQIIAISKYYDQISTGNANVLGLKSNGTVVKLYGSIVIPSTLTGVVAISVGANHALALKANGNVVAFGSTAVWNVVPKDLNGVIAIAAGTNQSMALKADGTIVQWGAFSTTDQQITSVFNSRIKSITTAQYHSMVLKDDGSVVAWGINKNGSCDVPTAAASGIISIGVGDYRSFAVTDDGYVVGWGNNIPDLFNTIPVDIKSPIEDIPIVSYPTRDKLTGQIDVAYTNTIKATNFPTSYNAVGPVHLNVSTVDGLDNIGCSGVVTDSAGNVYVTDSANHVIRKKSLKGTVTVFAGTLGSPGSVDAKGTAAKFNNPTGIAIDLLSNVLFVADTNNHTIRSITSCGTVTTIAGIPGVSGTTDGNLGVAKFNSPQGIAYDSANYDIVIADTGNHTIRKILSAPGALKVETIAGQPGIPGFVDGSQRRSKFNNPTGICWNPFYTTTGNYLIADTNNGVIRELVTPDVTVSRSITVASTVAITGLTKPTGIAMEPTSIVGRFSVYVSDPAQQIIYKSLLIKTDIVRNSNAIFAGAQGVAGNINGLPGISRFNNPIGLAADTGGNIYVADRGNSSLRKIGYTGTDALPNGLSVDKASGVISGTPSNVNGIVDVIGVNNILMTASNSAGSNTRMYALRILASAPTITSSLVASNIVGQPFSYQITAINNPTSFDMILPPSMESSRLTIDKATGIISGYIASDDVYNITLIAYNYGGSASASLILTATLPIPVINSSLTATAPDREGFSYQITATNSPTYYSATGLPPGLLLNPSTGLITGAAATKGTYNVTISATNRGGTGSAILVLNVISVKPVIDTTVKAVITAPKNYSYQITAAHFPTSYNATGLPSGMSVNTSTGLITGTSPTDAVYSVTITASNSIGTDTATLLVYPAPVITSASEVRSMSSIATYKNKSVYRSFVVYKITATNSPTSYSCSQINDESLFFDPLQGEIYGWSVGIGDIPVTVYATNAAGTSSKELIITSYVNPPRIEWDTFDGQMYKPLTYQLEVQAPQGWIVTFSASGLPDGLSVNPATGLISGTPTVYGTFYATYQASNAGGTSSAPLTIVLSKKTVQIISFSVRVDGSDYMNFVSGGSSNGSFNVQHRNWKPCGNLGISTAIYVNDVQILTGTASGKGTSDIGWPIIHATEASVEKTAGRGYVSVTLDNGTASVLVDDDPWGAADNYGVNLILTRWD